jgi:hypothetical protein
MTSSIILVAPLGVGFSLLVFVTCKITIDGGEVATDH